MKKVIIAIMLCAVTLGLAVDAPLELLVFRIALPIKKSKQDKVREVVHDMWGPLADEAGKKYGVGGTNWADSGWSYTRSIADPSKTQAWYFVTMKQTDNRATDAKKNEWKNAIDGGTDADIFTTNTDILAVWQEYGQEQVEAP